MARRGQTRLLPPDSLGKTNNGRRKEIYQMLIPKII
jgi:hypothetical protein